MASFLVTQEPPHDLALAETNATRNADHIESRSPAVGQPSVSDGGDFEQNFLARPEIQYQNFPDTSPTAFKSSLDGTRMQTPARPVPPLSSSFHHRSLAVTMAPQINGNPGEFLASHDSAAYVAIDPFVPSVVKSIANSSYLRTVQPQVRPTIDQNMPTGIHEVTTVPTSSYIIAFLLDTLPRQMYLYFLLKLPSLYFSRVARIFEEAELSMPDIKRMVISSTNDQFPSKTKTSGMWRTPFVPSPYESPVVARFKASWEQFVDSLMEEWKTLNLVSVLLLSAILTTLQIDGAVTDPYARYFAFMALVCSLMSLLYGCIYIIRFNTMRRIHRAAEWAEEAQKTKTFIWWNVWVLLAMPAIWLSWSIIFYLTCVMTFLWRTGTTSDTVLEITPLIALGPRLSVTLAFILGLVYLCLIISEFQRYGDAMDKAWKKKVLEWKGIQGNTFDIPRSSSPQGMNPLVSSSQIPPRVDPKTLDHPAQLFQTSTSDWLPQLSEVPFPALKIIDLRAKTNASDNPPWYLEICNIGHITWKRFISDASQAWNGPCPRFLKEREPSNATPEVHAAPQDVVAKLIAVWNAEYFLLRATQAVLCEEQTDEEPNLLSYAIYLIALQPSTGNEPLVAIHGEQLARRFGGIPVGVRRINLYDPVTPYGDMQRPTSRPLRVHLPRYRQPDLTSRPPSISDAWATDGPDDEAEKISNNGRSGGVPSLYSVPDMGYDRQRLSKDVMVSTIAAEEDNGLSTLAEQEISQEERQLNQHDFDFEEENNSNNTDGWPIDWRSDYGTIIPGEQRPTTSIDDFKDPTKRTICATLSYVSSDPCVTYDLRYFPSPQHLTFPILRRLFNNTDFAQLATDPPVEQMRLCHPLLPWYIDVRQSQPSGVTVLDVLLGMFDELQLGLTATHFHNTELDTGANTVRAFQRRTQGNKEESAKGIKRVDYLEDKMIFMGLVRTGKGLWEMKTVREPW